MDKQYEITAEQVIPAKTEDVSITQISLCIESKAVEIYFRTKGAGENSCERSIIDDKKMDAILAAFGVAGFTSDKISKVTIKKTDVAKPTQEPLITK